MNWFIKRFVQSVLTVLGVISISFGLVRLMPGGPTDFIIAQYAEQGSMNMQQVHEMVELYIKVQPDEPLWQQYINYVVSVVQGDLGVSMWYDRPVAEILAEALPWTIFIMGSAIVIAFTFAIIFGAIMAYKEGSRFDVSTSMVMILTNSTPYYLFAIFLVLIFAYEFSFFPATGRVASEPAHGSIEWFASVLHHGTLPILSMVITTTGGVALAMRGNSIQVLGEDYLRVARLRGLSQTRIATRYVARNAILPLYTGLMIAVGNAFGGAIILEVIFGYYGVGYYIFRAVEARDYPLLMGGFIVITIAVVIALLIADLTYGFLDPRAGIGGDDNESY